MGMIVECECDVPTGVELHVQMAGLLPVLMDEVIEVLSRGMIRRYHQGAIGIVDVLLRDGCQPLVAVRDFMHTLLVVELPDRPSDVPVRQVLDNMFEGWIAL